jgi:hypothetical protein
MRNSSQIYSWPKLLDTTPFPTLHLDHNNQALLKGVLIKVREATFGFRKNPSPKLRNYNTRTGSWLPTLAATSNQPFGMHLKHVHVPVSSPCLPLLLGSRFLLIQKEESDFNLGLRKEVPFVQCHLTTLLALIHDTISWKFLAFISLATWCGTFVWFPAPLKERWCPHHVLCLFCLFVGLVWNSFMASWACSISDSFTQDASIGWYPFHLTKYSCSHPLSCLDLNTTSTSNSGSLWTKSGGVLELCSRLGLEASQATSLKRETWNVGWTLRFSSSSNL